MYCSACGGVNDRGAARYCADCGKLLAEGYEPLDAIRSSYGMQRGGLAMASTPEKTALLFEPSESVVTQTAWACVVYSMVPYLGILFLPFAFATSALGYTAPDKGSRNRRLAAIYVGLSFFILLAQAVLWSLFYIVGDFPGAGGLAN